MLPNDESLQRELQRIAAAHHHMPHDVLGAHRFGEKLVYVVHLPDTHSARLLPDHPLQRLADSDFFTGSWPWRSAQAALPAHCTIERVDGAGNTHRFTDPYSFAPTVDEASLQRFASGNDCEAWRMLGAHAACYDGIEGIRFAVWAPNASRVSVVGPFCDWDGRRLPMRVLGDSGVWELFVPGLAIGTLYKFEIRNRDSGSILLKSDPYARAAELRPDTASAVTDSRHVWRDADWMRTRREHDWLHAPLSIYEVHAGSWQRHADGRMLDYRELAAQLIPYVKRMGFTHIELLPISEHPLDDSWGYQTTGYFAPTRRHGSPDDLRYFIDECHAQGIGVLLDWVPGHFPRDEHALARFDGTALYEYADARKAEHRDWGTLIFNYERNEVRSFLLSSACYWLEEFHFDGLRVDAVASMLYLDFGRGTDYIPNQHGGRENLEAIDFLRTLNTATHSRTPGTMIIAEESTAWPQVTRPADTGGLGFSMKWNMGWMHDTLDYFKLDPVHRSHHHHRLTFGMMYAWSENYVLALSHDEVVHLKRSLLGRMPGDRWQQMANLRLLHTYMWTLPGKKLLFMGGEFGTPWEWDFRQSLPWWLTEHQEHRGVQSALADLNRLYASDSALHRHEFEPQGFQWIDCDDASNSVLSYIRRDGRQQRVVVLNFTPVPRTDFRIGVPQTGSYREVFNSDSAHYGGGNLGNDGCLQAEAVPAHGQPYSLRLTLPPLAGLILAAAEPDGP
jgi:1,4-alpha-glucan branching enzyme